MTLFRYVTDVPGRCAWCQAPLSGAPFCAACGNEAPPARQRMSRRRVALLSAGGVVLVALLVAGALLLPSFLAGFLAPPVPAASADADGPTPPTGEAPQPTVPEDAPGSLGDAPADTEPAAPPAPEEGSAPPTEEPAPVGDAPSGETGSGTQGSPEGEPPPPGDDAVELVPDPSEGAGGAGGEEAPTATTEGANVSEPAAPAPRFLRSLATSPAGLMEVGDEGKLIARVGRDGGSFADVIQFFVDGQLLGERGDIASTTTMVFLPWTPPAAGHHVFTAVEQPGGAALSLAFEAGAREFPEPEVEEPPYENAASLYGARTLGGGGAFGHEHLAGAPLTIRADVYAGTDRSARIQFLHEGSVFAERTPAFDGTAEEVDVEWEAPAAGTHTVEVRVTTTGRSLNVTIVALEMVIRDIVLLTSATAGVPIEVEAIIDVSPSAEADRFHLSLHGDEFRQLGTQNVSADAGEQRLRYAFTVAAGTYSLEGSLLGLGVGYTGRTFTVS